ncbi:NAD(P)H-dependent oxidoreductase [Brevibacillus agri]|uniref:NAD(P)H-dependent oxidoreductase n=1 Tax=Brevibacillus agri TaxID=51101 RepID=UPI003B97E009
MIWQLKLAYFAAILNAAVIGVTFLLVKLTLTFANPLDTLTYRFAVAFAILLVPALAGFVKPGWRGKPMLSLLLLALLYPIAYFVLQTFGLQYATSAEGGIISAMTPAVTMIFASIFLKEKTTLMQKLSLLLSASGIVFIYAMNGTSDWSHTTGIVLLVLACITLAGYNVLARLVTRHFRAMEISFFMVAFAFFSFLAASLGTHAAAGTIDAFVAPLASSVFIALIGNYLYGELYFIPDGSRQDERILPLVDDYRHRCGSFDLAGSRYMESSMRRCHDYLRGNWGEYAVEFFCDIPEVTSANKESEVITMHIAMIAGSNRQNATSTSVLRYIETILKARNIQVSFIDLRVVQLPLYSPDSDVVPLEADLLITAVKQADGLIFATPEYHGSLSGSLKNALDYLDNGHVAGKPVLPVSSAGGPLGISSLIHLQGIIRNLHGILCPEWISIGDGQPAFDRDGVPQDMEIIQRIDQAVEQFIGLVRKLGDGSKQPVKEMMES